MVGRVPLYECGIWSFKAFHRQKLMASSPSSSQELMADHVATTSCSKQQHVVAVPLPAQGHLNPLMRFCTVLASHGFLVTFVNIDAVHHRLEELVVGAPQAEGIKAGEEQEHCKPVPVLNDDVKIEGGSAGKIQKAHIPVEGLDLASDFRVSFEHYFEALNSITLQLEVLIQSLNHRGPTVTCIVSDVSITLPTQDVADKLNIPRLSFVPCSASFILLCYHVIQEKNISTSKVLEALKRREEERSEIVGDGLAGLPTLYIQDLPWYKHVVDDNLYLWKFTQRMCQDSFRRAYAMVFNSSEVVERPALTALSTHLSLPVYGMGPFVEPLSKESSTSLWREDEACIRWLDQQPPLSVLYISFGSISLLSQAQIEEIVAGLISSQQRFLWVFRPDLVRNVEYSSTLASDIPSRSHGKGYVVSWAPQLGVLAHPSVGGFLTHCGWNSVTEAVAHGVPMICWPYFADQFLDAKIVVEEWKVGLRFEGITVHSTDGEDAHSDVDGGDASVGVERGEVERVIRAVMQGEEGRALRSNAMRLKEAHSQSRRSGGSSHSTLQALLSHISLSNN